MARALNRLSARFVATAVEAGRYADGGNLYLSISPSMGLPITGKGADLSLALLGYVRHRLARDGDVHEVGPVSLTILSDTEDWGIRPAEWVLTGESCITIGLGLVVQRVVVTSH